MLCQPHISQASRGMQRRTFRSVSQGGESFDPCQTSDASLHTAVHSANGFEGVNDEECSVFVIYGILKQYGNLTTYRESNSKRKRLVIFR